MKIAIIGNGIVGATTAFYLAKGKNNHITMFDSGIGQATKASAGIIAPWLSKRRSKVWYRLARNGADVIHDLAIETRMPTDVYEQSGVIYLRKNKGDLKELLHLGLERRKDAPLMGEIQELSSQDVQNLFTNFEIEDSGLFVAGGAKIDGAKFVVFLNKKSRFDSVIHEYANLTTDGNKNILVNGQKFDRVILAAGAWLPKLLQQVGYQVNVRPQKGQLIEVQLDAPLKPHLPVLMPEGERDFIPQNSGSLIIGATHENDGEFDLNVTERVKLDLLASGQKIISNLTEANVINYRVGTRAYTGDFLPFFGSVPNNPNLLVASGLGSSGLTTGPLIGKLLSEIVRGTEVDLTQYSHPVSDYTSVNP